ncbi:hypothetical protein VNO77_01422 [Canavalia gladiata]|uniref:Uncharacterized protein n=1 Tax=Canavalia gladiata TaxID=3824 RepID=A0AAN9R4Y0_CANGL
MWGGTRLTTKPFPTPTVTVSHHHRTSAISITVHGHSPHLAAVITSDAVVAALSTRRATAVGTRHHKRVTCSNMTYLFWHHRQELHHRRLNGVVFTRKPNKPSNFLVGNRPASPETSSLSHSPRRRKAITTRTLPFSL